MYELTFKLEIAILGFKRSVNILSISFTFKTISLKSVNCKYRNKNMLPKQASTYMKIFLCIFR